MTRDEWERILDGDPSDGATRLIYADWLEEEGLAVEAELQRWLGRAGKYPSRCSDGWHWFSSAAVATHAELTGALAAAIGVHARWLCYRTRAAAEQDLLAAWMTLRPSERPQPEAGRKKM